MNLTQKERMLLEDQRAHEEDCVQKYQDFSNQAQDPQLKQLFQSYAAQEQQHLNTINQILSGQIPNMTGQNQQQSQPTAQVIQNITSSAQGAGYNQNDAKLCKDSLMTEKFVSGAYNTTIFECTDKNLRQVLNHIQKEEQQHGEGIFNYMRSKGMYPVS
ncbi:spore coat protein [Crassaminicella thermophila]|uniref:Spore coat protein n=1 Tax=Crassaminicella thermophila TaxID=2599308 RepID=A0A5C0SG30_CRATE|nr:spore coat protein [Crassaminicella thermophila]QEK12667.1 spore coat protein [Crassaminicella thermophila]